MASAPNAPGSPNAPRRPAPGVPAQGTTYPTQQKLLLEALQYQRAISHLTGEVSELRSKLAHRTHQISILRHISEILAATPKVAQILNVLLDFFVQEFDAKSCVVWTMEHGGESFQPRGGHGLPRSTWARFVLPAPNPFPDTPIVLFQDQILERSSTPQALVPMRTNPDMQLVFIPFEHQLLLLGFAVLGLPAERKLEEDQETLNVLQRQVAVSIYNAWLFKDLGEQRDVLRDKTGELELANVALREADRFKSEFLALTSHELRTPLTGIMGFTRLVLDGLYEDEEEMRRMLADSYTSSQHLLQLLNDILDLAKIESGRFQMNIEPWSLGVLLEEIKPVANGYPHKAEVALIWPEDAFSLPLVSIDPGRLKQVLLNLLSNALKFTKEGSVRVSVERGFGQISIAVIDTGIGVDLDVQPKLFQKFVQAEGGHSREYGGTGLGLVICKHLMEMMGGSITLHSQGLGQGTTMTLMVVIA
jgi:signal transduction histidine kinase